MLLLVLACASDSTSTPLQGTASVQELILDGPGERTLTLPLDAHPAALRVEYCSLGEQEICEPLAYIATLGESYQITTTPPDVGGDWSYENRTIRVYWVE